MRYPHLFSPLRLGNVTYRNRIFASPTGSPMVIPPEYLKRECAAFYELRAKGVPVQDSITEKEMVAELCRLFSKN